MYLLESFDTILVVFIFYNLVKNYYMNILLADDHSMTLEGYQSILSVPDYHFISALNCEEVYRQLLKVDTLDIAIIDHDMPAYHEKELEKGVDCALFIREFFPDCKIILITAHEEAFVLYNMHKKVMPDGLIVKSDFTREVFRQLIADNVWLEPYYSNQAKKALRTVNRSAALLDPKNREILFYLSQGYKVGELEPFLELTTSGIQKRISKMLHEFEVPDSQKLVQLVKKERLL